MSEVLGTLVLRADQASIETLQRITPLAWQHINFYGRYRFDSDLRPLNLEHSAAQLAKSGSKTMGDLAYAAVFVTESQRCDGCGGVYRIRCAGLVTLAALGRRYPRTMRAVGGEHAMKSCQVDAGLRHQRDKSGNEIHRLENHMCGAIAVRRFELVAHVEYSPEILTRSNAPRGQFIPTEDDW